MGGALTAPLACLGSCFGSCVAASCCKLAGSGEVSSDRAAKFVLIWLQVFSAVLASILSTTAEKWFPWTCEKLDGVADVSHLGICSCTTEVQSEQAACWSDQLVYRVEGSMVFVLLLILAMTMSGCAVGASRSHVGARFIGVILVFFLLLFVPNRILGTFGDIAEVASAVFLVAQAILLIDFAYTWNEVWYANALAAYRRNVDQRCYKMWLASILVSSGVILITAVSCAIHLYVAYTGATGRVINIIALILAVILLIISATDWCENGALLTSCVVTLYTVFMIWEMLAVVPSHDGPYVPVWVKLSILSISLVSMAQNAKAIGSAPPPVGQTPTLSSLQCAEMGQAPQSSPATGAPPAAQHAAASDEGGATDKIQFGIQCGVHIAASLYICASLAPKAGQAAFVFHAMAVIASLLLYGWTLAAPKLLAGRDFS